MTYESMLKRNPLLGSKFMFNPISVICTLSSTALSESSPVYGLSSAKYLPKIKW